MNIFPDLSIPGQEESGTVDLPVYREWAYDFKKNEFMTRGGRYYLVEKNEALKIWIYKALLTNRYRYQAYSRNFGSELEETIGLTTNREILESEIKRYIEECLLVNPYILEVEKFRFEYGAKTEVFFTVITVYGEEETGMEVYG